VRWDPALRDPALLPRTIPPAQTLALGLDEVVVVTTTVEIRNAARLLDVNFGVPLEPPLVDGIPITAPNTGQGTESRNAWAVAALATAVALSIGGAILLARRAALRPLTNPTRRV
jgi:hypothetical protein